MKWESFSAFVSMGGYGLYVWGSYVVTVAAIGIEAWLLAARHRAARQAVRDAQGPPPGG